MNKGKAREAAYPNELSFSLENRAAHSNKGANEYSNLNQIRVCNIHRHSLLSFVWRVSSTLHPETHHAARFLFSIKISYAL